MNSSPVEVIGGSKVDQALQLMQSALELLDDVECPSTAVMHLDLAISVLGRDIRAANLSKAADRTA